MLKQLLTSFAITLLLPPQIGRPTAHEIASNLGEAYETYCLDPDGNQEATWTRAERDGFALMRAEEFPGLSLPGARRLRGYEKTNRGVRYRVLTAVNRWQGRWAGYQPFHMCWVSAEPADRDAIDREVQDILHIRRFREDGAFVYAWTEDETGDRRPVSSREFRRTGVTDAFERRMRLTLTNQHQNMVAITLMTPVGSCEDWCY